MLLTFLICVLIVYVPLPGSELPARWFIIAGSVGLLAAFNFFAGWLGSSIGVALCRRLGRRGLAVTSRIFALLKGLVIGLTAANVFVLKWPLLVARGFEGARWALLAHDVLLLAPVIVMVLTLMAWEFRVEARVGAASVSLSRYLWLRTRLELGIILVPWLLLVLATDLTAALFAGSEYLHLADLLATGGVLAGLVVFSPALLRGIWPSSPLPDGPLRKRLEDFGQSHKLRFNDILVWHTDHHVANAGVVGPTPLLRYVLITDALLQGCDAEEVVGIFAHEVAHVRRRHIPFYMLMAVGFLAFFATFLDGLASLGLMQPLADILAFDMTTPQALLMLGFALVYWVGLFGLMSRRMELEADLFALREVGDPESFLDALDKLSRMSSSPRGRSHWRHFSIERRIRFLRRVMDAPSVGDRFLRRLRVYQVALAGLIAAAAAYILTLRPELVGL